MMKRRDNYPTGILNDDVFFLKKGSVVCILEERGDNYIVRMYHNTPALTVNKSKVDKP